MPPKNEKKVTLYYSFQTVPNSGIATDYCHLRDIFHKDTNLGKIVIALIRRKHHQNWGHTGFGRHEKLVVVDGWSAKYESYNTRKDGVMTIRTPKFSTAEEWEADFDKFLTKLIATGVEVHLDYRKAELGTLSYASVSAKRERKITPPQSPKTIDAPPPEPEMVSPDTLYAEGAIATVELDRYERSKAARDACLGHYGRSCQICGLDFATRYQGIGDNFIEVHHLTPLSEIGEGYQVDPVKGLLPVCPNCHAMIHRKRPIPYTPNEIRVALGLPVVLTLVDDEDIPF